MSTKSGFLAQFFTDQHKQALYLSVQFSASLALHGLSIT